MLSVLTY